MKPRITPFFCLNNYYAGKRTVIFICFHNLGRWLSIGTHSWFLAFKISSQVIHSLWSYAIFNAFKFFLGPGDNLRKEQVYFRFTANITMHHVLISWNLIHFCHRLWIFNQVPHVQIIWNDNLKIKKTGGKIRNVQYRASTNMDTLFGKEN